jgi:Putative MetA-pathway of phenol degradation
MVKHVLMSVLCVAFAIAATAQTNCGTKLYCLIPTAFHTPAGTFSFLNEAFGTQIGQLPLATPASGFIFTFDKSAGVYKASSESFGPILTERYETIGRHKFYAAFTYQYFAFSSIDGTDLRHIPIVLLFPSAKNPTVVTATNDRIDAKVDQYAWFATFGLTSRIDVSVAVPVERISMGATVKGTEFSTISPATATFSNFLPGSASGVGDVLLSAKGTIWKTARFGLAAGADIRIPSGDAKNFLGSGAVGVKPYLAFSRRGRIAPHLDLGYQWNADSILATNSSGKEQQLPTFFLYSGGADFGVSKRLTLVGDLVGQHFFNAPLLSSPRTVYDSPQSGPLSSVVLINSGSYTQDNVAVGMKANPIGRLLITANALIKVDNGGLRSRVVPMGGISYSF